MDILTDFLSEHLTIRWKLLTPVLLTFPQVITIPVALLWEVQLKPRQKLGLGFFLCLSISMIIVAAIRMSGIIYHGTFDNSWIFLWQQIETCIAVMMISLTAFHSVFVANSSKVREKKKISPWLSYTPKAIKKHRKLNSGNKAELYNLTIPSATLTGMGTVIRGGPMEPTTSSDPTLFSRNSSDEFVQGDNFLVKAEFER